MKKLELSSRGDRNATAAAERSYDRLTHYLFRYPAKFHPPVARALIERFTSPGDTVFDPFCGSGTILVEACATGRNAIGTDIDPVAVFVSRTKSRIPSIRPLQHHAQLLLGRLEEMERSDAEYERRKFDDVTEATFTRAVRRLRLNVPHIPNISHWFRRYVVIDLARILKTIETSRCDPEHRDVFLLSFAAIIRNSSNADPVPVSGLEVTSHMKQKDAQGRVINPYHLYRRALARALEAYEQLSAKTAGFDTTMLVVAADATELDKRVARKVDAVLTSPPYHNAVDYYRRHTLEMYWLRLVNDHQDRLALLSQYIGRSRVRKNHPSVQMELDGWKNVARWERNIRVHSDQRADAFRHYMMSMRLCMSALGERLERGNGQSRTPRCAYNAAIHAIIPNLSQTA